MTYPSRRILTMAGIATTFAVTAFTVLSAGAGTDRAELKALSNDPAYVSGGDVLLQIRVPSGVRQQDVRVMTAGRDVTAAFHADKDGALVGLVTGLASGKNTVSVSTKPVGGADASLDITNYPITGPIISGP